MGTRVRIMGLEIDLLTQETLQAEITGYLSNDVLNVIHIISVDYMDTCEKNETVQEVLAEADMVLPGEKTILSAHHVEVLETGGMAVDYHSMLQMLESMKVKERTFYLVLRNEKEAKGIYRYMTRHGLKENVLGVYVADGNVAEETMINDINTKLPDIILLSMDSPGQEEWLLNNRGKINAKLCLAAGSIIPHILRENVHVPAWIRKIHCGGVFRFIVKIPNAKFFRERIFNRKMDDYITKKKLRGNQNERQ